MEVPKTSTAGMALKAFCDANRPAYEVPITLSKDSWTGTAAPYTYEITNSNIDGRKVTVNPTTMTYEQEMAVNKAMFSKLSNVDNTLHKVTVKALAVKPTVDIPCILSFEGVKQ